MQTWYRWALKATPLLGGSLATYWFTEGGPRLSDALTLVLVIPCAALLCAWALDKSWLMRGAHWPLLVLTWSSLAHFGNQSHTNAYNDCVLHGERTRQGLLAHLAAHAAYPLSLAELGSLACGQRLLHPSVLRYERTDTGFELWLGGDFGGHRASESEAFTAYK